MSVRRAGAALAMSQFWPPLEKGHWHILRKSCMVAFVSGTHVHPSIRVQACCRTSCLLVFNKNFAIESAIAGFSCFLNFRSLKIEETAECIGIRLLYDVQSLCEKSEGLRNR